MKTKVSKYPLVIVCVLLLTATAASGSNIAEIVPSGPRPDTPLSCLKFNGTGEHTEPVFSTDNMLVRLVIPGCTFGCVSFEGGMESGMSVQLGGSASARFTNQSARIDGGIAVLDIRSSGRRIRMKIEACGDFTDAVSALMAVEIVFGQGQQEGFYAKGEWAPKLRKGQVAGWQLTRRAAKRE